MPTSPLVIERTYRAPLAAIWPLWTTKEGFESWWGPQGFRVEVHALNAQVGGELRYDMIAATEEMIAAMKAMGQPACHPTRSTFAVVAADAGDSSARLVIENVLDFLPGVDPYTSRIEVAFTQSGDTTRMTTTLGQLHSPEFTKMQVEGYTSQLSKLDGRFV